ncbi:MAG: hypothetical protein JRC87_06420 [Deltaproteobacteria bacterium]|nr:hypothetical protein [Deltaproteobacteria bacterium]MBW2659215.1 hypothetical protein [Deltaproteobacteria bacterium]
MIKKIVEEQIASFTVENEARELKKVIVSQVITPHYDGEENYPKRYRLESLDGLAVFRTEDPDILTLSDGSLLRRKNR